MLTVTDLFRLFWKCLVKCCFPKCTGKLSNGMDGETLGEEGNDPHCVTGVQMRPVKWGDC